MAEPVSSPCPWRRRRRAAAVAPTRDELRRWYALMHLGRILDDKAPNYLKQGSAGLSRALRGTTPSRSRSAPFRPNVDYLFRITATSTCVAAG